MFVKKLWMMSLLLISWNLCSVELEEQEKEDAQEQALEVKPLATEALLIFLDESEYFASLQPAMSLRGIHPISLDLIKALEQRAAPILASTSLLHNVFFQDNSKIAKEFRDSFAPFVHDWKASFFGRSLVLLTPGKAKVNFLEQLLRHKKADAIYQDVSTTLERMGRMYNGFSDAQIKEIIQYFTDAGKGESSKGKNLDVDKLREYKKLYWRAVGIQKKRAELGKKHTSYYGEGFIDLFERQDKALSEKIPEWKAKNQEDLEKNLLPTLKKVMFADEDSSYAVYINGHGRYQEKIAGVSVETLTMAFNFFERGRRVALVVLKSCYAAGSSIKKLEEEVQRTTKTLSFPIVIQGIIDSAVVAKEDISFTNFVNNVTQHPVLPSLSPTALTFEQALEPIMVPHEEDVKGAGKLINQAQIKFPSLPWMLLGGESKRLVTINEVLSKTRKKPLNVNSFFKTQELLGVLFYAQKVPFMLEINGVKVPYLVSMVPGDAAHRIGGIRMNSLGWREIVNQLYTLFDGMRGISEKIFLIEDIAGQDNTLVGGENDVVRGLLVRVKRDGFSPYKENMTFYLGVNGVLHKKEASNGLGERILRQDPRFKEYRELKERVLKETEQDRADIENLELRIGDMARKIKRP